MVGNHGQRKGVDLVKLLGAGQDEGVDLRELEPQGWFIPLEAGADRVSLVEQKLGVIE